MTDPNRKDPVVRAKERLEALERAARELSTTSHTGRSADGLAAATVDGSGRIVDLRLPASLLGLSAERLGAAIVAAAADAEHRARASRETVLDGLDRDLRRS